MWHHLVIPRPEDVGNTHFEVAVRIATGRGRCSDFPVPRVLEVVAEFRGPSPGRLIDDNVLDRSKYSRMLVHSIRDDAAMAELGVATKLNPDWDFLCRLRGSGRAKAAEWLDSNFDKVGQSSTVDLTKIFL